MSIFKILIMLVLFFSFLIIGENINNNRKKRIKEIKAFLIGIINLGNEIRYHNALLSEGFLAISKKIREPEVAEFFCELANQINLQNTNEFYSIWGDLSNSYQNILHLNKEDWDILNTLCINLGNLDIKSQLDNIDLCKEELLNLLDNTSKNINKQCKFVRTISVFCGLFICIIIA